MEEGNITKNSALSGGGIHLGALDFAFIMTSQF